MDRTKWEEKELPHLQACRAKSCALDLDWSNRETSGHLFLSDAKTFFEDKSKGHKVVASCTTICCLDDKGQKAQTGQHRRPQREALGDPSVAQCLNWVM